MIGFENVGIFHNAINIPMEMVGANKLPNCGNDWMKGSIETASIIRKENGKLFRQVSGVETVNIAYVVPLVEPDGGLQGWGLAEIFYRHLEVNICSGCIWVNGSPFKLDGDDLIDSKGNRWERMH